MRHLIPDTIAARTLLVLVVGLSISHLLSVALYLTDRTSAVIFTGGEHTAERIATTWRLIRDASQAERNRIAELADYQKLHVFWSQESAIADRRDWDWQAQVLHDALLAHVGSDGPQAIRLRHEDEVSGEAWQKHLHSNHQGNELGEALLVSFQLREGEWLNFAAPVESPEPIWSLRFGLSMAVMLLAVGVLSALVVHHLIRPLGTFVRAAQRLGTDVNAPAIPERGPAEVRQAIKAFNDMQDRIRRFVDDRTQMLAAISHDLGTPITRLRLRAELIEDNEQKGKTLADLDDMEKMVSSALSFARNESDGETRVMADLKSLLQRTCDDISDAGRSVTLDAGDRAIPYACRPVALRRALTNLIDNAIKYGGKARVQLRQDPETISVRIDDDGPGIPNDFLEDAFKPFRRLDASRSRETGGSGLGLTVARTIVRAHGGDLSLANRAEGGLRVEVRLPK